MASKSYKRKAIGLQDDKTSSDDDKKAGNGNSAAAAAPTRATFDALKVGEKLSRLEYYTVIGKTYDRIEVKNERGFTFTIGKSIVDEEMFSATQYDREEKVSLTELIERFMSVGNVIFQVSFEKKLKDTDIATELKRVVDKSVSIDTDKDRRAFAKKLLHGESRTLIGYLVESQPTFARSDVVDLELPETDSYRKRQVDHRTLQWMIYKRVKYIVK